MNILIVKNDSKIKKLLLEYGYENIDILFFEKYEKRINIIEEKNDHISFFQNKYQYLKNEKILIKHT